MCSWKRSTNRVLTILITVVYCYREKEWRGVEGKLSIHGAGYIEPAGLVSDDPL